MTCKQIITLIDTLPPTKWTQSQHVAAQHHADHCDRCRTSLASANKLHTGLTGLADATLPSGLASAIMARTARLAEERSIAANTEPLPKETASDRLAWAAILCGSGIFIVAGLSQLVAAEPSFDLIGSRIGWGTVLLMRDADTNTLFLAAGLILYLAGLLAPSRLNRSNQS